tara:strand:- start:191 stop:640 length:450 start_codon:yes stop_codon:yes gene_type:complete
VKHTNQLDFFDEEKDFYIENKEGHSCTICNTFKKLEDFTCRDVSGTSKRSTCKDCINIQTRTIRELKKQYPKPIDPNYSCPCCGKIEKELKQNGRWQDRTVWCLDHDHDNFTFRGWLCNNCNQALGRFYNIDILNKAIQYLNKHEEGNV